MDNTRTPSYFTRDQILPGQAEMIVQGVIEYFGTAVRTMTMAEGMMSTVPRRRCSRSKRTNSRIALHSAMNAPPLNKLNKGPAASTLTKASGLKKPEHPQNCSQERRGRRADKDVRQCVDGGRKTLCSAIPT